MGLSLGQWTTKQDELKQHLGVVYQMLVSRTKDAQIRDYLKDYSCIAGGAIRNYLTDLPINDYDIFFHNETISERIREKFEKEIPLFTSNVHVVCITDNAITLQVDAEGLSVTIQFILKFTGKPNRVIKSFDFTNSMAFYTYRGYLNIYTMMPALLKKELVFNPDCSTPVFAIKRVSKFKNQGYTISFKELFKVWKAALLDSIPNKISFLKGGKKY